MSILPLGLRHAIRRGFMCLKLGATIGAIFLASLFVTGLPAQEPPRPLHFADAKVIKIDSTATYYQYTVETDKEGYVVRSERRLLLYEGSLVKIAVGAKYVILTDEKGRPNQTVGATQYRLPTPSPPKKNAALFGGASKDV